MIVLYKDATENYFPFAALQAILVNSFTKEELQEILRCLDYMTKGGTTPYSCLTIELKKKTRYLIEHNERHEKTAKIFEEFNSQNG
jgi:hypothetical protein